MSGGDCKPETVEDVPVSEVIWRRVGPHQIVRDESGNERASSAVFKSKKSNGISLHRAKLTQLATIQKLYPQERVAQLRVADVLAENSGTRQFRVIADPVRDHPSLPDDESHACIVPTNTSGSVADHLVKKSWLISP